MSYPKIIQGGMGVGVSNWILARTVSMLGQLGVVSGVALDTVLVRRLQMGDLDGHVRRAMSFFPYQEIAKRVLAQFFVPGGKSPKEDFKLVSLLTNRPQKHLEGLIMLANFVEVFLAKEGHEGLVGINFLEKIQLPTLLALYGAMLAGVDYVLMGAGIPRTIPGIMDDFAKGKAVKLKLDVEGAVPTEDDFTCEFNPREFCGGTAPVLKRPKFLAIISSATLAMTLARKSTGKVDGFIVEGETAGGHNAPPRGQMRLNEKGEPIYGERDVPDLVKIQVEGLPFWLAGSYGRKGMLAKALSLGAAGIQVGTAFAFCNESGMDANLKRQVIEKSLAGNLCVFTDPLASPTSFPFKVIQLEGTMSDPRVYNDRCRICDLGYLRKPYRKEDGTLGYRCASEPEKVFIRKGGKPEETDGRKCICNSLMVTIGIGSNSESPLITSGDDLADKTFFLQFLREGNHSYGAIDVINCLLKNCE